MAIHSHAILRYFWWVLEIRLVVLNRSQWCHDPQDAKFSCIVKDRWQGLQCEDWVLYAFRDWSSLPCHIKKCRLLSDSLSIIPLWVDTFLGRYPQSLWLRVTRHHHQSGWDLRSSILTTVPKSLLLAQLSISLSFFILGKIFVTEYVLNFSVKIPFLL